ncbi:MAG: hypothetical protein ABSG53_13430, partial [Thermoguttaceae bacterium]
NATRVPLRSDTRKVVLRFWRTFFQHLEEIVITKGRGLDQKSRGKISLYTPIVETKYKEDRYATPMQHQ